MNTFQFTPTQQEKKVNVPFFEEARADYAPHYNAKNKSVRTAQDEIIKELAKLGGAGVQFQEGFFGTGQDKRYGYVIYFQYNGAAGIIRVAGLPMRHRETQIKIGKIRLQALLNVRDWLKATVTGQIFSPGSEPLMQYLLVDGMNTIADYIAKTSQLPRLNPVPLLAGEVVEGEG